MHLGSGQFDSNSKQRLVPTLVFGNEGKPLPCHRDAGTWQAKQTGVDGYRACCKDLMPKVNRATST